MLQVLTPKFSYLKVDMKIHDYRVSTSPVRES